MRLQNLDFGRPGLLVHRLSGGRKRSEGVIKNSWAGSITLSSRGSRDSGRWLQLWRGLAGGGGVQGVEIKRTGVGLETTRGFALSEMRAFLVSTLLSRFTVPIEIRVRFGGMLIAVVDISFPRIVRGMHPNSSSGTLWLDRW